MRRDERGTSTRLPSKLRMSLLTTARTKPGKSLLMAVSSTAGIRVPCETVWPGFFIRVALATSEPEETLKTSPPPTPGALAAAPAGGALLSTTSAGPPCRLSIAVSAMFTPAAGSPMIGGTPGAATGAAPGATRVRASGGTTTPAGAGFAWGRATAVGCFARGCTSRDPDRPAKTATPSISAPPAPTARPMPSFLRLCWATSGNAFRFASASVSGSSSIRGSDCWRSSSNMSAFFILALRDPNGLGLLWVTIDQDGRLLAKPHHHRLGHLVDHDELSLRTVVDQTLAALPVTLVERGHRSARAPLKVERATVVIVA